MLGNRQDSFILFLWLCLDDDDEFCEPHLEQPIQNKIFVYASFTAFKLKSSVLAMF